MNKKLLMYAIVPAMALTLIGAGTASAQGWFDMGSKATPDEIAQRQQQQFTTEATLLGVSVDDVKNAWAQGKNMQELAKEKGINMDDVQKKMQELRKQKMTDQLKTLVDKGVITQAQADQRLKALENTTKGKMGLGFGLGQGRHGGKNCPMQQSTQK